MCLNDVICFQSLGECLRYGAIMQKLLRDDLVLSLCRALMMLMMVMQAEY